MGKEILKLQNGSDIRGIAAEGVAGEEVNLTALQAGVIGSSFVYWLVNKLGKNPCTLNICIGHDPRITADEMVEGLKKGICIMGVRVSDAGLASTPAMFMSTAMDVFDFDGAIMVTASHLPFNRNGFKFFTAEGGLNKEDITWILNHASKINFVGDYYESEKVDLMSIYASHLRRMITQSVGSLEGMKIVVDAGNGAGGFFATEVLGRLGADVSGSQFLEPDGMFPNHQPNPENKEAMESICRRVVEEGADLGLIFDTDVDRSAAVTSGGKPIARNEIVALAAALGADDYPGGTVVTDSITSNELHEFLEKDLGLKHYRYKRGYRNVINKAMELAAEGEQAFLAIETSGHCAYSDNYFLDDGAFLAVQIVVAAAQLKKEGRRIEDLIAGLKQPAESEEVRLTITDEDFGAVGTDVLMKLEEWVGKKNGFSLELPNYEGVRANFDIKGYKGWFLMRKSLHDPVLALNIESNKEGGCSVVRKLLHEFMDDFGGVTNEI